MRHWLFTRIDQKPERSPRSFSNLLEGGASKSFSDSAASININLTRARDWISRGNLFERFCAKMSAVSRSPKEWIIHALYVKRIYPSTVLRTFGYYILAETSNEPVSETREIIENLYIDLDLVTPTTWTDCWQNTLQRQPKQFLLGERKYSGG